MEPVAIPIEPADSVRCSFCGHRNEFDEGRCCHCGHDLSDQIATGEDLSPYAYAVQAGTPGWWRMCRWVWGAGSARMSHLALMQASAASRRFAAVNLLWLSFAVGLVLATATGWRLVRRPLIEGGAPVRPGGRGWLRILGGKAVSPDAIGLEVQVWWNLAQSIIAGVAGLLGALLAGWVLLLMARGLIEIAHRSRYRGERRMSAAVGYGTAWIVPLLPCAVILALYPLSLLGEAGRWAVAPSSGGLLGAAGLIAGLAAMMAWFWLIRLGATAPADTRGRVVAVAMLVVPAVLAAGAVGVWMGLSRGLEELFWQLNLSF